DVVQACLENLQHLFSRHATALQSAFINTTELALEQAIIIAELLLFDQAKAVISMFPPGLWTMNTGAIVTALKVFRWTKNWDAESAANANTRTSITSHSKLILSDLV